MITRNLGTAPWKAACAGAPPPLDVTSDNSDAAWYPLPRMVLFPQPPGPQTIKIPIVAPLGDDPTNRAQQTEQRHHSYGMIPWLDASAHIWVNESGGRK
jgi:hypothetical protein